jgi:putative hemolysin
LRQLIDRLRPPFAALGLPPFPVVHAFHEFSVLEGWRGRQPAPLGQLDSLDVRLAQKPKDVRRAQKLRYRVFYEEMAAVADYRTRLARRDIDAFDAICDHLLVRDHQSVQLGLQLKPKVVGTYRLLRQSVAARHGSFYSAGEFEIGALTARHPHLNFLELGRSCVLAPYRNKRTVELLWHGIWAYVLQHRVDVMFGCASLEGIDPERLALPLSYLHHFASAPAEWRAQPVPERRIEMNRMSRDAIDAKAAWRALPPLIKGYLRLGAFVGDGAVIDHQFGTTDVLMILPVSAISARYVQHFGERAERYAA